MRCACRHCRGSVRRAPWRPRKRSRAPPAAPREVPRRSGEITANSFGRSIADHYAPSQGHANEEATMQPPVLSRRAAFAALSVPAAGAFTGAACAAPLADSALRNVCTLTPQSIEGPYYLDPRLVRAQIAEDRPGVPLRVDLRVIDGATCKPSERARVDLWHADAQGIYSGYDGRAIGTCRPSAKNSFAVRNSPIAKAGSVSKRSIRAGTGVAPRIFTSRC